MARTAAALEVGTYAYPGQPVIKWDHVLSSPAYRVCLKLIDGIYWAAFEGTASPLQWFLDFDAIMEDADGLGSVSQGFNIGLPALWPQLSKIIGQLPWISCGHSRGAAQCTLVTGHAILAGKPPLFRVCFGEPLSCDAPAAKIIGTVPSQSFCNEWNGHVDPIVQVPPPIVYARVKALTKLRGAPSKGNPWLDYPDHGCLHFMPDYASNVNAYFSQRLAA